MPDLTLNWWSVALRGAEAGSSSTWSRRALWGAHNFVSEAFKELSG